MLGEIALILYVLMALVYLGGSILCIWSLFKFLLTSKAKQAFISLFFIALMTVTSVFCALPAMKMHGSYSDGDRLLIIGLVASNIALMIFIIRSRYRTLNENRQSESAL